jgi:hypothetical protein
MVALIAPTLLSHTQHLPRRQDRSGTDSIHVQAFGQLT